MELINRGLHFLYLYYRIYIFFIPTCMAAFYVFCRKNREMSVGKKVLTAVLLFVFCGICCYLVYRWPLLQEKAEIQIEGIGDELPVICRKNVSFQEYSCVFTSKRGASQEVYEFHLPVGEMRTATCTTITGDQVLAQVSYPDSPAKLIALEALLKIVVLIAAGGLLGYAVRRFSDLSFRRLGIIWKKYSFGILVFAFLMFRFILNLPEGLDEWSSCWYAADYSMGMGSRFLIGSMLSFFCGDYIDSFTAYSFCTICSVAVMLCTAILTNAAVKTDDSREALAMKFVILVFLCFPGSVSSLWNEDNFGKLELYTLLVTLAAVVLFHIIRNSIVRYICLAAAVVISMAIYQGYIFLYYPILFSVLFVDAWKEKKNIRKWGQLLANGFVAISSFYVFQFFSYVKFESAEEMAAGLAQRTDLYIDIQAIHYECFAPVSEAYKNINTSFLAANYEYPREKLFLIFCMLIPVIVLAAAIYDKCMALARERNLHIWETPYFYIGCTNFAVLPQFLLNVDWGRWLIAISINTVFGILYLAYRDCSEMKAAMRSLGSYIQKHMEIILFLLIFLSLYSGFGARDFLQEADKIWNILGRMLGI